MGRKCTQSVRFTFSDGEAEKPEFTLSILFRVEVYLHILDKLHAELKKHLQAYAKLSHKFGFFHNVLHLDAKQLKDGVNNLVQQYPNDLEPSLAEELVHFRQYFKGKNLPDKEDVYRNVGKRNIGEVFPNVEIALQNLLLVSVDCAARRFLKVAQHHQHHKSVLCLFCCNTVTFKRSSFVFL